MSMFLSAGVYVKEKDISDVAPRVATSSAAIVGYSAKGSVDNILLITNDQQFIENYGEPDQRGIGAGHYFHQSALAFLARGNVLYCLRVENAALYGGAHIVDKDSGEVNTAFDTGVSLSPPVFSEPSEFTDEVVFQIFGADPGSWNNKIGITITNVKGATDLTAKPPIVETDAYTFEINVYYQNDDGDYELLEIWKVSRKKKKDGYGRQLYLEDKINGVSKYIVVKDNITKTDGVRNVDDDILPLTQDEVPGEDDSLILASGSDGSEISSAEVATGWGNFTNPAEVDVRLLINGGEATYAVQDAMKDVAEARFDCIAILDMPYASTNTASDMLRFRETTQNFNSSYCALYSPWPKIYDPYNDLLIRVPPSGYVAAQIAYTDYVGNPWDAPAGFTRGMLDVLEITKLDGRPFTEGDRDVLYPAQINPLQMFRGEGNVIWGQRTEQVKSSALSRVQVRRLLIIIEKTLAITLRQFTWEPNNEITRFRIESLLDEYLERLSSQGAFQLEGGDKGYHVVCDESNNTASVIDDFALNVDVFIKPVRAAEYIQLQIIPTRTGASFKELIAKGIIF